VNGTDGGGPADERGWVTVRNGAAGGFRADVTARDHHFVVDEPAAVGGTDAGPTPYEYLVAALGACTALTLRMYAGRKGWPLADVVVRVRHGRSHEADCEHCEQERVGLDYIERDVELAGP